MTTTPRRTRAAPVDTFPAPTATSEELITGNLGLARKVAWKYHSKSGQPYDELEAVAYVGLIKGCRKFDPTRINPHSGKPYALSTIVIPFVEGEVLHWFRDHGHTIKFPSKWREKWGLIQRLMADPDVPAEEVAERAGMSIDELGEMLGAMRGTADLDDCHGADAVTDPEHEEDRLQPLRDLTIRAIDALHPGDREQFITWWGNPRRLAFPAGPIQQFHRQLQALLNGRRPIELLQMALGLDSRSLAVRPRELHPLEQGGTAWRREQRRKRRELDAKVAQLGLLAGMPVAAVVADQQPEPV